jgi:hypothetical protein
LSNIFSAAPIILCHSSSCSSPTFLYTFISKTTTRDFSSVRVERDIGNEVKKPKPSNSYDLD